MLGLLVLLAVVVLMIPERPLYLADDSRLSVVDEKVIAESGVGNPVTAVLLNFRAYDTLLELAVLVLAVIGVQAAGASMVPKNSKNGWQDDRLLQAALAILVPVSIVVAGDLLWMGADHPGGAFQAGAVLSGAGIMLILGDRLNGSFLQNWRYRLTIIAGVAVFVMVGLLVMMVGQQFLEYPAGYAKAFILAIETAAMGSVAVVFIVLFGAVAGPLTNAAQEDRQ
jgi:multisubunit Na+/H+ antiporter MnhB subunit